MTLTQTLTIANGLISLSDDSFAQVNLPFNFSFFGEDKNTVKISSNGYLGFGSEARDFSNDPILNPNQPNDFIAPFWDDLNPGRGGAVYYYHDQVEDQFIVQYQDVPRFSTGGSLTFQAILDSDGSILYQYDEMNATLTSATIGIENADASEGVQVAYNQSYVHDDLAVSIVPTPGTPQPQRVVLRPGDTVTNIDFGNQKIPPTPIFGTRGDDILTITDSPVIVFALAGDDEVDGSGSIGGNQFYGGKGDDTLTGNSYDQLFGEAGDDRLDVSNGAGNNLLDGGKGDDELLANLNDQLFGGKGHDTLDASSGGGNNLLDGGKGDDVLLAGSNDHLLGGKGEDILNAINGGGNNLLDGGKGDDNLFAGSNDQLLGGKGDDILNASVGTGNNSLDGGKGDDNLLAGFNDQLSGGDGDDILNASFGSGNNSLDGGDGDDILIAGFNDQLSGGDGDDLLFGGYGGSTMTGGNGDEQFWIVNGFVPSAAHTITDFEVEIDRIGIRGLGITFQQLDLIQDGNDTRISVFNTDLAILSGIQASALNSSDFILA
ncbi:MAG: calcium-binding protein [Coleofasciculus sp. C1-SOL-03]|uniref:calcium-binding protein n=1 Tax=Coleofasciculus sp. C1-SOL-03 TaxID=3069522 RepID=UPI0033029964